MLNLKQDLYPDPVKLGFTHRLEVGDLGMQTREIMLDSVLGFPSNVLLLFSLVLPMQNLGTLTSGEEILTFRTFSSMIF